jgi:leader peptidase (prepilin peptidase)/N-methyltransferase
MALIYLFIFLYGITIGSFLNVVIYRVPKHENIAVTRSHCMTCGYQLRWFDLIPLFSWLALRGRCRKCKAKISVQYPIIEAANGIIYVITFAVHGLSIESAIYCLLFSALLALSVIDFRTFEIPFGINVFILTLGVVHLGLDYLNWRHYVIGLLSVSIFLAILYYLSGGRAIGGGDVKLMGAAGLLIGWKLIILAFFLGCIFGSVIHIIRMKLTKAEHVLAMGPYLSAGIFLSALWGDQMIEWYLHLYGR